MKVPGGGEFACKVNDLFTLRENLLLSGYWPSVVAFQSSRWIDFDLFVLMVKATIPMKDSSRHYLSTSYSFMEVFISIVTFSLFMCYIWFCCCGDFYPLYSIMWSCHWLDLNFKTLNFKPDFSSMYVVINFYFSFKFSLYLVCIIFIFF